jgi:hypothetical protein
MMNNLPPEFKKEWIGQDLQIQALRRSLRLGQVYWRALSIVSAGSALVAVVAGIWFALQAIHNRDLLYALSAFALLSAVPPAAVAEVRARREGLKWYDETPEGTIRQALRRTVITERLLRITFFNGCVLTALVVVVWSCILAGLISNESRVIAITAVWLGLGIGAMLWVRSRRRVNRYERERCEKLLRDYAAVDEQGAKS